MRLVLGWLPGLDFPGDLSTNGATSQGSPKPACTVQPGQVLLGGHGFARVLGPASTNFDDYLGTVAADDAEAVLYGPSLYELADLDRDRFTIFGSRPQSGGTHHGDGLRYRPRAAPSSEIAARGRSQGKIPVVPFDLPEASAEAPSGTPSAGSRFDW